MFVGRRSVSVSLLVSVVPLDEDTTLFDRRELRRGRAPRWVFVRNVVQGRVDIPDPVFRMKMGDGTFTLRRGVPTLLRHISVGVVGDPLSIRVDTVLHPLTPQT